jgi:5-methylcytosine-specific restriction endonuclease McrA
MRLIDVSKRYESKIYVIDDQKLIIKLDCECRDFQFRRIKKIGDCPEIKYYSEPCKHLKPFVERLQKMGYKLKVPEEMIGSDKMTKQLWKQLLDRAGNKCEETGCENTDLLTAHRRVRGSNGGKYNMKNCIVLCRDCHIRRHANEFPSSKSR